MIKIGKSTDHISFYSCQPGSREELKEIIEERISKEGLYCDLNDIDTSLITDMSYLFHKSEFNGNVSNWNMSNVEDARGMFVYSHFNGDISKWNVSNVKDMYGMLEGTSFNGDISKWNVSNVENMRWMFAYTKFNQDISNWKINKNCITEYIFDDCSIEEKFKPKSLQKK